MAPSTSRPCPDTIAAAGPIMRNSFFRAYGFRQYGEGFQTILLPWYMTFHANLSAAEIGFYQSLQLAPFLLFTALGGSLTDRIGARSSFAIATAAFAVLLGLYGLADPGLGFSVPLFAAYCLLSGLFSAFQSGHRRLHPRQFGALNHAAAAASSRSMGPDPKGLRLAKYSSSKHPSKPETADPSGPIPGVASAVLPGRTQGATTRRMTARRASSARLSDGAPASIDLSGRS